MEAGPGFSKSNIGSAWSRDITTYSTYKPHNIEEGSTVSPVQYILQPVYFMHSYDNATHIYIHPRHKFI